MRRKLLDVVPRIPHALEAHGVALQGAWASRAEHATSFLVDAPGAHQIEDAFIEMGFLRWNTITVRPVSLLEDLFASLPGS
ncbi:MAG: hypothetical protein EXR55_02915 [Dehalococcoidia bacterium]|nr:hypothetical protein [Dehalococcoidia bacterium]